MIFIGITTFLLVQVVEELSALLHARVSRSRTSLHALPQDAVLDFRAHSGLPATSRCRRGQEESLSRE